MRFKTTTPKALLALAALAPVSALASTTNPTVATWQMTTYDTVTANGLVETSQTSATGNVTKVHTDGAGRTIEQVDALGNVSTAEYDANGNLTKSRDANGVGQDCTYDAQNRRTACTDTAGSTRTTKYSVGGLVLNQQDAKTIWNAADAQYDARGHLTKSTSRLYANDATTYTYDANGNKLTVTDGEGKTTTYQYDDRNLKTAWTFPGQTSTTRGAAGYDTVQYQYDEAARLVAFLRQDGTEDDTTYNFNGTVASKTYKLANGTTESQDTYTYDASNRPLTASKGRYNNTVAFAYDAIGRKQEESLTVGGNTYPVAYAYDADNRTTSITYPDGKVMAKTYTERNQLQSASFDGQAILTTAAYDAGGRETSRTLGNGVIQDRTYRSDGLLSAITTQGDAASSLTYSYDANKNLTAETLGGVTAPYSATMAQDAKDRLTSQARTNGDAQSWNLTNEGDWASQTTNGTTETRTHNDNHQIIGLSSTANAPTYDAQGDLQTDEQARAYTWDQEKSLTGIVGGTTNVGFAYDALGRRVSKTSNGNITVFVSAGNQEIAEYANGALAKEHVYGTYVDENIATVNADGSKQYRVMDRRYSTTALLNDAGVVVERYVYDAYGKTTVLNAGGVPTGAAPLTDVLWTGRRLDSESGNYYFRSRYFSTTLGRFISRDIDYLDGWNLYEGYFAERNGADPTGMWTLVSGTTYKADKNGETLSDLAIQVDADAKDGDCIWVVGDWKDPSTYTKPGHEASCGDQADVNNLVTSDKNEFKVIIGNDSHFSKAGYRGFLGNIPYLRADRVGAEVAKASGRGNTPISYFLLGGHGGGPRMGGTTDGVWNFFYLDDLLDNDVIHQGPFGTYGSSSANRQNTYKEAQQNHGPCRCWFTRSSQAWFVGCTTKYFAQSFASGYLRPGATAHGTNRTIWLSPFDYAMHWGIGGWAGASTWSQAPIWESYKGTN